LASTKPRTSVVVRGATALFSLAADVGFVGLTKTEQASAALRGHHAGQALLQGPGGFLFDVELARQFVAAELSCWWNPSGQPKTTGRG
jgi:hypothetical protein